MASNLRLVMVSRTVEPEILDSLPAAHPDAVHNRRDLRLTNLAMGNHRWIARHVPRLVRPGERVLEIGAGTGELAVRLQALGLAVDGLDFWDAPPGWPVDRIWHRADVCAFDGFSPYRIIVANLILHQLQDTELRELGTKLLASARVIVACEPARSRSSQWLYRRLAPLFGANEVSLHDAHVSIAAGFLGRELPDALGLPANEWASDCGRAPVGAYHLIAVRRHEPNATG